MPVVIHQGRIYRAFEDASNGTRWGRRYSPMVISASVNSDLLKSESWSKSPFLKGDPAWLQGKFNGWLEGNILLTRQGNLVDILRVDVGGNIEKAAVVSFDPVNNKMNFDPEKDFINFPGGAKKFTIRYDEKSKRYWSLSNWVPPERRINKPGSTRNTLAIVSSSNLREWTVHKILLENQDQKNHGFQYVDWLFSGQRYSLSLTHCCDDGVGGAHNNHDANFLTFHRLENFRSFVKDNLEK